jgi:hypothetical protein
MGDGLHDSRESAAGLVDALVALDQRLDGYLAVRTFARDGKPLSSFVGRLDRIAVKPSRNETSLIVGLMPGSARLDLARLTAFRVCRGSVDGLLELSAGGRRLMEVGARGWSEVARG